jgi:uncharacterized protein (DUF433 family)
MVTPELQEQLLSLPNNQKTEIIQMLVHSLDLEGTWSGISKTPGVMGGEACIRESRIPVWLMVSYRRMGSSEAEILENYPTLMAQDLVNAWRYAEQCAVEIDRAIARQEAD